MTDFLRFTMERFTPYAVAAPLLARALRRVQDPRVVDLCSGGGGPWRDLVRRIPAVGGPAVTVTLTDAFPNRAAFARLQRETGAAVHGEPDPVNATRVPERLHGFRTVFTGLHHFRPRDAHAILADAVHHRTGIAVFEMTERSLLSLIGMLLVPLFVLLATPFIRPFRWTRLLVTYVIPLVPVAVWFDATVSCLRSYTPNELRALTEDLREDHAWEVGIVPSTPFLTRVTYVIGVPGSNA